MRYLSWLKYELEQIYKKQMCQSENSHDEGSEFGTFFYRFWNKIRNMHVEKKKIEMSKWIPFIWHPAWPRGLALKF